MAVDKICWQVIAEGQYHLSGVLDRDTVPDFWRQRHQWMPHNKRLTIDLADLSRVDSAGMVMLLHLCQQLEQAGSGVMLHNVPQQLKTLFRLSHIEPMLAACME
ncbi:anti-sigma B factor antagonist [Photobacterium kishitanii]|uniref:STAS domain-containing protein n=1 Tax=Photobacterium kishitanii TaxID=318456 RepID=A0AAX0YVI7_9GAMM|nr:STAS domain-containing protein [Photobacterium kishitanii]KJG10502.1 anti-sigma B factor antagonist [Photobacterium kishitanii]KJG57721.1 anti-sigma B factor antagonist [Photobacterium kishitanii]KJG61337.1 anti-sigma B factor antagonist [Photobacterium kishitanii]KJG65583.1 anti-sigma B factor antagonist [Photobacterium kishitanii]KJG70420.1 anti-sigma B factor antagonist [Photobacterium kishitanii]